MADIVIINPRFEISFWGWSIASVCWSRPAQGSRPRSGPALRYESCSGSLAQLFNGGRHDHRRGEPRGDNLHRHKHHLCNRHEPSD